MKVKLIEFQSQVTEPGSVQFDTAHFQEHMAGPIRNENVMV